MGWGIIQRLIKEEALGPAPCRVIPSSSSTDNLFIVLEVRS